MIELRVDGADKLARVTKALRDAGNKELAKELRAGITRATKPLKQSAKKNAAASLPTRGGLGARVARTTITTSRRGGAKNPGIRLVAKKNAVKDPARLNAGRARHPVYGRPPWVLQDVPPGWFTKPMQDGAPVVRSELITALDAVAVKIARAV